MRNRNEAADSPGSCATADARAEERKARCRFPQSHPPDSARQGGDLRPGGCRRRVSAVSPPRCAVAASRGPYPALAARRGGSGRDQAEIRIRPGTAHPPADGRRPISRQARGHGGAPAPLPHLGVIALAVLPPAVPYLNLMLIRFSRPPYVNSRSFSLCSSIGK